MERKKLTLAALLVFAALAARSDAAQNVQVEGKEAKIHAEKRNLDDHGWPTRPIGPEVLPPANEVEGKANEVGQEANEEPPQQVQSEIRPQQRGAAGDPPYWEGGGGAEKEFNEEFLILLELKLTGVLGSELEGSPAFVPFDLTYNEKDGSLELRAAGKKWSTKKDATQLEVGDESLDLTMSQDDWNGSQSVVKISVKRMAEREFLVAGATWQCVGGHGKVCPQKRGPNGSIPPERRPQALNAFSISEESERSKAGVHSRWIICYGEEGDETEDEDELQNILPI